MSHERRAAENAARAGDVSLSEKLSEFLNAAFQTTLKRIQNANGMSASEVLQAGAALERVMGEARAHIDETRSALAEAAGTDGRGGVSELARRQSDVTRAFISDCQRLIAEQERMAKQSELGCTKIVRLGGVIDGIAAQAKLLALNARIEAARLGSQGAALSVIASEMVRFSKEVGVANGAISELTESLARDLPRVAEHAGKLRVTTEEFSERCNSELDFISEAGGALERVLQSAISAGDERAQRIVSHTYAALSHLQFQDTCAQHLLSIGAVLEQVVERVPAAVEANRPELLAGSALEAVNKNLSLNAGDVTLFTKAEPNQASGDLDQAGGLVLF
jgi:methyl-accepting chemotaxis protein